MNYKKVLSSMACCFLVGCSGADSKTPPSIKLNTLFKPEFTVDGHQYKAGHLFAVNDRREIYLVTAHHLFGPAGDLERQYSSQEIASSSVSVNGLERINEEMSIVSDDYLVVENATVMAGKKADKDITIFQYTGSELKIADTLDLASSTVKVGDTVWLYAKLKGHQEGDAFLHPATVTDMADDRLMYKFSSRFFDVRATSGAPVLNSAGDVVGMNVGIHGIPLIWFDGLANPLNAIKATLDAVGKK